MKKRDHFVQPIRDEQIDPYVSVITSGFVGDPEVQAMQQIHNELQRLPQEAKARVLRYFAARFGVTLGDDDEHTNDG